MNIFVSMEDVLAPVGETTAPTVGLQVADWDENIEGVLSQVVDTGYAVKIIDRSAYSAESINPLTGIQEPAIGEVPEVPQVIFYYKGASETDVLDGIPVLMVREGKVQVSHEGRMKELAEYMGLLNDDRLPDHGYQD